MSIVVDMIEEELQKIMMEIEHQHHRYHQAGMRLLLNRRSRKSRPKWMDKKKIKTRSFRLSALQLLASYQRHLVSAAATPLPIKSNIPTADGKFLKRKVSRASTLKEGIIFAPKNVSFAFTNPSASSICQSIVKTK